MKRLRIRDSRGYDVEQNDVVNKGRGDGGEKGE
jgi:hypothetical protein